MNVADFVRVSDLRSRLDGLRVEVEVRDFLKELLSRVDLSMQSLTTQLRAEPTVFSPVNPSSNVIRVQGAKRGDIAVYRDTGGNVAVHLFD